MEEFLLRYLTEFTYAGVFTLLMLTLFGFPFPEDAVLMLSGVLASRGVTKVWPTLAIAYVGVVTGDMILYWVGRKYGRRLVEHKRFGRILTRERLERAERWFDRWGNPLIFFGRHMVGLRAQILLCSGVFRLDALRVLTYDGISAVISVPLMVGIGYYFGHHYEEIRDSVLSYHWTLTGAVAAVALAYLAWSIHKRSKPKNP